MRKGFGPLLALALFVRAGSAQDFGFESEEKLLPFSVAIASFASYDRAQAGQREWTRPDLPVYVVPTLVNQKVYYRVLAGMLPEREQAEALMHRLVSEGVKEKSSDWDVRPTPLAFCFGTTFSEREVETMLQLLEFEGIPAYKLAARQTREAPAYRVCAGGYRSPEEGEPLAEQLARAGFHPKLENRIGLDRGRL